MSDALVVLVAAYAAVTAAVLVAVAFGAPLRTAGRTGLVLLECLLVTQAGLDLLGLVRGHRPQEPGTHAGYLVASVILLPLLVMTFPRANDSEGRPERQRLCAEALAAVAMAVVSVRLHTTWAAGA